MVYPADGISHFHAFADNVRISCVHTRLFFGMLVRLPELLRRKNATVNRDIQTLLKEWRESRLENMDLALQLELERIDETCRELWEQWEKSKTDYTKTARKQKGSPTRDSQTGATSIRTYQTERTETEVTRLGDPSYIAEIRQQLAERRKLLGLYAPEKKDISGDMSFAAFLIESGIVDDNEQK